ncbi:MAG: cell division protein FtsZ, partial [Bacteroidota bacterium]
HGNLSISEAFAQADNILTTAAKGIAEIITVAGYVNVDFEDVNTVMRNSGVAIMGTAEMEGEDRAKRAVDAALNSPLLEDNDIRGAQHILINIASGTKEVTMDEIFEITEFVQEEAGYGTDLIWGNCFEEALGEKIAVTIIATGFEHSKGQKVIKGNEKVVVSLDDEVSGPRPNGLYDLGKTDEADTNTRTYDYEEIRSSINKYKKKYSYDEPYVKNTERERKEEKERQQRLEVERQRRERLRKSNLMKLSNPQNVIDLENEPAYLRRNVSLDDVPHSSDELVSKWTISDDEEPELRENNSFIHDKPD